MDRIELRLKMEAETKKASDNENGTRTDVSEEYVKWLEQQVKNCSIPFVSKRYYWLKADGTISNMWNEEDHKKYISEQDIKDAEKDGWQLIQINVC